MTKSQTSTATIWFELVEEPPEGVEIVEGGYKLFIDNGLAMVPRVDEDDRERRCPLGTINTLFDARFASRIVKTVDGRMELQIKFAEVGSPLHPRRFVSDWQKADEGDVVTAGERQYRVTNVVLPNAETKVIGWFQLDPLPERVPLPPPSLELVMEQQVWQARKEAADRRRARESAPRPPLTLADHFRPVYRAMMEYRLYLAPLTLLLCVLLRFQRLGGGQRR